MSFYNVLSTSSEVANKRLRVTKIIEEHSVLASKIDPRSVENAIVDGYRQEQAKTIMKNSIAGDTCKPKFVYKLRVEVHPHVRASGY